MKIEAMLEPRREATAHVHKAGYAKRSTKKKKICRRAKKRAPTILQDLYVSCTEVFKGPGTVPLHHDVKRLCYILGMFLNLMEDLSSSFFLPVDYFF